MRRRALAAAMLAVLAAPAQAVRPGQDPPRLRTPRPVRLRPGAAPVLLQAELAGHELRLGFAGPGAPEARIALPSWYGNARVFGLLPFAGRELVLAAFEGNTGSGTYQEIQAVIGQDDGGALRILALETLHYRLSGMCGEVALLRGRLAAAPGAGSLRIDYLAERHGAHCGRRGPRPPAALEAWSSMLAWEGSGAIVPPPPAPRAGPVRRRVEEARARVAELLEAPRTRITPDDIDRSGLMELFAETG